MKSDSFTIELSLGADEAGWLKSLARTLRPNGKNDSERQLDLFVEALEKRPHVAQELRDSALRFVEGRHLRGLFCEAGINWGPSLFTAAAIRLLGKVLPPPPRPDSLQDAVRQAFPRSTDNIWLSELSDHSLRQLASILTFKPDDPVIQKCRQGIGRLPGDSLPSPGYYGARFRTGAQCRRFGEIRKPLSQSRSRGNPSPLHPAARSHPPSAGRGRRPGGRG